jgi:hypothetical protein
LIYLGNIVESSSSSSFFSICFNFIITFIITSPSSLLSFEDSNGVLFKSVELGNPLLQRLKETTVGVLGSVLDLLHN